MAYTLKNLASHVGGNIVGDENCEIESVATLENAGAGQITFLTNIHYKDQLKTTRASAVIMAGDYADSCPTNALVVENPHAAYAKIAQLLYPGRQNENGIHQSACIDKSSKIHESCCICQNVVIEQDVIIEEGVYIGAGSYIGKHSRIGKHSHIYPNVTLCRDTRIGERVILHPGVVVGADGFGQAYDKGKWLKVPQIGAVVIGNDVEIGANTTVDCGAIENTILEDGVKLDNQIQIGHNVHIGEHTVIAAATAVAGSTRIGKGCMIGGAVAIAGHLTIADNVVITGMSLVTNSIGEAGSFSSGMKAMPTKTWHRLHARLMNIDDMAKRLRNLEKK